jgi:hypothetical protein
LDDSFHGKPPGSLDEDGFISERIHVSFLKKFFNGIVMLKIAFDILFACIDIAAYTNYPVKAIMVN